MNTTATSKKDYRKKLLAPLVVLLLCAVSLSGAAYAYSSQLTASNDFSANTDGAVMYNIYHADGTFVDTTVSGEKLDIEFFSNTVVDKNTTKNITDWYVDLLGKSQNYIFEATTNSETDTTTKVQFTISDGSNFHFTTVWGEMELINEVTADVYKVTEGTLKGTLVYKLDDGKYYDITKKEYTAGITTTEAVIKTKDILGNDYDVYKATVNGTADTEIYKYATTYYNEDGVPYADSAITTTPVAVNKTKDIGGTYYQKYTATVDEAAGTEVYSNDGKHFYNASGVEYYVITGTPSVTSGQIIVNGIEYVIYSDADIVVYSTDGTEFVDAEGKTITTYVTAGKVTSIYATEKIGSTTYNVYTATVDDMTVYEKDGIYYDTELNAVTIVSGTASAPSGVITKNLVQYNVRTADVTGVTVYENGGNYYNKAQASIAIVSGTTTKVQATETIGDTTYNVYKETGAEIYKDDDIGFVNKEGTVYPASDILNDGSDTGLSITIGDTYKVYTATVNGVENTKTYSKNDGVTFTYFKASPPVTAESPAATGQKVTVGTDVYTEYAATVGGTATKVYSKDGTTYVTIEASTTPASMFESISQVTITPIVKPAADSNDPRTYVYEINFNKKYSVTVIVESISIKNGDSDVTIVHAKDGMVYVGSTKHEGNNTFDFELKTHAELLKQITGVDTLNADGSATIPYTIFFKSIKNGVEENVPTVSEPDERIFFEI